jgi:hypothetical protein
VAMKSAPDRRVPCCLPSSSDHFGLNMCLNISLMSVMMPDLDAILLSFVVAWSLCIYLNL